MTENSNVFSTVSQKLLLLAVVLLSAVVSSSPVAESRNRREVMFRPLFVYRQQQVEKQRLHEERVQKQQNQHQQHHQAPHNAEYAPNYGYPKNSQQG